MYNKKFAVVDIETTGQSSRGGDRMIQIAVVIIENGNIQHTFSTFIHPQQSIPAIIQSLTNISDEDVKDAMPFEHYAQQLYDLIDNCIFVAHNVDFDLSFLQSEWQRVGCPKWYGQTIDTVELVKFLYPTSVSYQLSDLAEELSIQLSSAHRADEDALATAHLLMHCWKKLLSLPLQTLQLLHKESLHCKSDISKFLFDAIVQKREQLTDDSRFVFYHQIALRPFATETTKNFDLIPFPKSEQEKIALLRQGHEAFEQRDGQLQMMDTIWNHLTERKEVLIEASTGIGKTIGYLVPAICYAMEKEGRVLISTYTIPLMEQLLHEELPKLEKIIGRHVQVAVLKGRHHYIDVVKFQQMLERKSESYDEALIRMQLLVWLTETLTGDVEELTVTGGGKFVIEKLVLTHKQKNVPFEICFHERALQAVERSELVVTNHAMLVKNLQEGLHAKFEAIVIDEAHQVVSALEQQRAIVCSYSQWKYTFSQMGTLQEKQLLTALKQVCTGKNVPFFHMYRLEELLIQMRQQFDFLFSQLQNEVLSFMQRHQSKELKMTVLLQEMSLHHIPFYSFSQKAQLFIDELTQVVQKLILEEARFSASERFTFENCQDFLDKLKKQLVDWDALFVVRRGHDASWIEFDQRSMPSSFVVYKKPIAVAPLSEAIFREVRAQLPIVWLSSSLTVPSDEQFISSQLSIPAEVELVRYAAPAHYYAGAKAFIVTDMPDIQTVSQKVYVEAVAQAVISIVLATGGRSFVLFTSKQMLKETVDYIIDSGQLTDFALFAQGVTAGSRTKLLKAFQKFQRSILFGTNSFWEGVDVPNDGLRNVIVVRLPFSSPDDPMFKAKQYGMHEQGMNAFQKLSLPEAIIRFKQAFGRLIRSTHDRGAFIILDKRIESKSYGEQFTTALPPISVEKQTITNMVLELEHWYNNEQ